MHGDGFFNFYANSGHWYYNPWVKEHNHNRSKWFINGQQVPNNFVVRRDPNCVPFQSVSLYGPHAVQGLQDDPRTGAYPCIGHNGGYLTERGWASKRPMRALAYQAYDAESLDEVEQNHE